MFRLTDPILAPSLYLGTEIGSAGRTLNRPLQKARFTLQALLEFDRRVWMDRLTVYIHDLGQGDACIVAVARLVSLWRNTCNYNALLMYSHSVDNAHSCSSWFALGLDSTYVYRYQGALLPVELSQRHPLLFLRKVSKPTTHPDIGATQGVQAAFCLRRTFPLHCLPVTSRSPQTASTRLGAVAFTVVWCSSAYSCGMLYPTSYIMTLPW